MTCLTLYSERLDQYLRGFMKEIGTPFDFLVTLISMLKFERIMFLLADNFKKLDSISF